MRALLTALTVFVLTATNAEAFGQCAPHELMIERLKREWNEILAGVGITGTGSVVELLISPGGSFTLLVTRPTGISCVMVGGQQWEAVPPPPKGEPA